MISSSLFTVFTANPVVHEFAFFCLSSLAVDFSAKITIAEKGGLPLLVKGLSSKDPDIQRNSAETLALMLQVAPTISSDSISSLLRNCRCEQQND